MSQQRPNIIFIMSDDHASHAMSCYGSRINETPHLDRIANEGMRFNNCFCTNSICAPSRATILTGTYNHVNGVTTLKTHLDNRLTTFPKLLQAAGYQTAIIGKWHLGQGPEHEPTGFDHWCVLPGQGSYIEPEMIEMGERKKFSGYVTDLITDMSLDWISNRDPSRPFMLLCHHKAPHRHWLYDDKHAHLYKNIELPFPDTFDDDYAGRAEAAAAATMRVERDMNYQDLRLVPPDGCGKHDLVPVPESLDDFSVTTLEGETIRFNSHEELKRFKYQRYIKSYLRCIASIDDNVGRMLDYLEENNLAENTIIVYTSDQGFFLGDHGWYDKRFMYEESLRMPFVMRYPREISPGAANDDIILNVDFAQTFLDYAGVEAPQEMQGRSFRSVCRGETPSDWRDAMYYRYWMHGGHNVYAHYGIRTKQHKLIYYYADPLDQPGTMGEPRPPEWELFDLVSDAHEMKNLIHDPASADLVAELKDELHRIQAEVGDEPYQRDA